MSSDGSIGPTHGNVRTTYEQAARGFDEAFKDALVKEITAAIANASLVTDAPIMAFRTGETTEALIVCLISTMAMSPTFDTPSHLREFSEKLAKRLRRSVANARANPPPVAERMFGFRNDSNA
jgi:hypothetical protein